MYKKSNEHLTGKDFFFTYLYSNLIITTIVLHTHLNLRKLNDINYLSLETGAILWITVSS